LARTQDQIASAIIKFEAEVPQLGRLKLVLRLELRAHRDVQVFRVRLPGPEITKGEPDDARVQISMTRSTFNELAADGKIKDWHQAYERGDVKVVGDSRIKQLVGQLIQREEARRKVRKVRR
jgi:hypothetical protein